MYLLTQRACLQAQHALLAVPWPGSVLALPKCRTILGADRRVSLVQSGIATCCIMCVHTYVWSLLPAMPSLLEKTPFSNDIYALRRRGIYWMWHLLAYAMYVNGKGHGWHAYDCRHDEVACSYTRSHQLSECQHKLRSVLTMPAVGYADLVSRATREDGGVPGAPHRSVTPRHYWQS